MKTYNKRAEKKGQQLFEEALQFEQEGKNEMAINAYKKSLAHFPENPLAHYNLGIALATKGEIEQALRSWMRAYWLDSSYKTELAHAFDLDAEYHEIVMDYNEETVSKKAA